MKGVAAQQQQIWPASTTGEGCREAAGIPPVVSAAACSSSSRQSQKPTTSSIFEASSSSSSKIGPQKPQLQQSDQKRQAASTSTATNDASSDANPSTTKNNDPPPPVLLLEGDSLRVSDQGIARSFYQLNDGSPLTLEERYHLEDFTKSFILREKASSSSNGSSSSKKVKPLDCIHIQEIDTQSAGTGGATWEASLAMSLYFGNHPEELQGNVVELGSGVGLGGILLSHVTQQKNHITLTDVSRPVLAQCQQNIENAQQQQQSYQQQQPEQQQQPAMMSVEELDWYDVLKHTSDSSEDRISQHREKYNTIIACDCAYRMSDTEALAETMKALLVPDVKPSSTTADDKEGSSSSTPTTSSTTRNKIHLFGPYNRVAFREVIDRLGAFDDLQVQVDWIEMSRYRLRAKRSSTSTDATSVVQHPYHNHDALASEYIEEWQLEDELKHAASLSSPKFLHVTAFYNNMDGGTKKQRRNGSTEPSSLSDID